MKTNRLLLAFTAGSLFTLPPLLTPALAGSTTPSRVSSASLSSFPYRTSGVIWNGTWRGSGTVAVAPKIAVSCAHVTYNNGAWLTGNNWAAAHHSSSHPANSANAQSLRGYWHWTGYSGGTSGSAFSNDFVVHYAYANLAGGASSGSIRNNSASSHPLASTSISKLIVGYPGSDGQYYMNSTGSFTSRYTSSSGHYLWNSSVKGGSGMSGGGVFAYTDGQWRLGGVHVSGNTNGSLGAGVRALNDDAYSLITSATTSSGNAPPVTTTRTFSSSTALNIPDNNSAWTVRSLSVASMPSTLTAATISLNISHTWIGDLEVMLTSPTGRSLTLHGQTGGSADNVVISSRDISSSFSGANPNGTWRLSMRDLAGADTGRLNSVSLTLSAR